MAVSPEGRGLESRLLRPWRNGELKGIKERKNTGSQIRRLPTPGIIPSILVHVLSPVLWGRHSGGHWVSSGQWNDLSGSEGLTVQKVTPPKPLATEQLLCAGHKGLEWGRVFLPSRKNWEETDADAPYHNPMEYVPGSGLCFPLWNGDNNSIYDKTVNKLASGDRHPGFKLQLTFLPAVWLCKSYLTSLCLAVLICTMVIIKVPTI